MSDLRMIITSDAGTTHRQVFPEKLVILIGGFDSFQEVTDTVEQELLAVLRKHLSVQHATASSRDDSPSSNFA